MMMESSIKFDWVSILNDEDIYIKFSSDINTVAWYTFTLRKKESLEKCHFCFTLEPPSILSLSRENAMLCTLPGNPISCVNKKSIESNRNLLSSQISTWASFRSNSKLSFSGYKLINVVIYQTNPWILSIIEPEWSFSFESLWKLLLVNGCSEAQVKIHK